MNETAPYVHLITHGGICGPEHLIDVQFGDSEPLDDGGRDLTMSSQPDLKYNLSLHREDSMSDLSISNVAIKGGSSLLKKHEMRV